MTWLLLLDLFAKDALESRATGRIYNVMGVTGKYCTQSRPKMANGADFLCPTRYQAVEPGSQAADGKRKRGQKEKKKKKKGSKRGQKKGSSMELNSCESPRHDIRLG